MNLSKPEEYTTKFYGDNSNNNINEYFGHKDLPKHHKCKLKNVRLNTVDDDGKKCHYAIWECRKRSEYYWFVG